MRRYCCPKVVTKYILLKSLSVITTPQLPIPSLTYLLIQFRLTSLLPSRMFRSAILNVIKATLIRHSRDVITLVVSTEMSDQSNWSQLNLQLLYFSIMHFSAPILFIFLSYCLTSLPSYLPNLLYGLTYLRPSSIFCSVLSYFSTIYLSENTKLTGSITVGMADLLFILFGFSYAVLMLNPHQFYFKSKQEVSCTVMLPPHTNLPICGYPFLTFFLFLFELRLLSNSALSYTILHRAL